MIQAIFLATALLIISCAHDPGLTNNVSAPTYEGSAAQLQAVTGVASHKAHIEAQIQSVDMQMSDLNSLITLANQRRAAYESLPSPNRGGFISVMQAEMLSYQAQINSLKSMKEHLETQLRYLETEIRAQ